MHSELEAIFDHAESRYLKPEELNILSQYVTSLPDRLETYRQLRDKELDIMQAVADELPNQLPNAETSHLERSIKNALLVLRYCAMAMLLNEEKFVKDRLLNWLSRTIQTYQTQEVDAVLYRLLNQQLTKILTTQQLNLLKPSLALAQNTLLTP